MGVATGVAEWALVDCFPPLLWWESGSGCPAVPGRRGFRREDPLLPQIRQLTPTWSSEKASECLFQPEATRG